MTDINLHYHVDTQGRKWLVSAMGNGTTLEIPENVYGMAGGAFMMATRLTEIHIPENVQETVEFTYKEILSELEYPSNRLTYMEKLMVMKKFEERGVFLFKGAIPEVAQQLGISEATAYRYLSKIERGEI